MSASLFSISSERIYVICNENIYSSRLKTIQPWRFITSPEQLSKTCFSSADLITLQLLRQWNERSTKVDDLNIIQNIREQSLAPIILFAHLPAAHLKLDNLLQVPGTIYQPLSTLVHLPDLVISTQNGLLPLSKQGTAVKELSTLFEEIQCHAGHQSLLSALVDFDYYFSFNCKIELCKKIFQQQVEPKLYRLIRALQQLRFEFKQLDQQAYAAIYGNTNHSLLPLSITLMNQSHNWIQQNRSKVAHQYVRELQSHFEADAPATRLIHRYASHQSQM